MARTVAEFEYLRSVVHPHAPGSMRLKKSVLDLMGERRPYGADEITADRIIHLIGLFAGGLGSAVLIGVALRRLGPSNWWPIIVYSACLVAMLGCSASYNLARQPARRERLRRLDHAAIFLMIAGTTLRSQHACLTVPGRSR